MLKNALVIAFVAFTSLAASREAQATVFDFTTGAPDFAGFGNSLTKTADGVTVVVTGWSAFSGDFTPSQVRVFSTGLGMCASSEGTNCGNGPHTVDNDGRDELFLLTFSRPVLLDAAVITAWASDFDASFWVGAGSITMAELGFAALGTQNNSDFNGTATAGSSVRTVDLSGVLTPVEWLAFGVKPGQSNDKFKFKSLTVSVPTPEPGLTLLLAAGALLLGARRRR